MHTPEGTLERLPVPVHSLPGVHSESTLSLPNKENLVNKKSNSVLRVQTQVDSFSLHKSTSEPVMTVINVPPTAQDSSPDTPQPDYGLNKGWITGFYGCLRPFLAIIGKGQVPENNNYQDDWDIPFEKITDLNFLKGGGQGMVFTGMLNNEAVAVKKVYDTKATDIKNLKRLSHDNIVKFKGVCRQTPFFSIVMEFCPYGALSDLLKNQRNVVTTNRVVKWAKQIATGMNYLHSQKIIHRDLKSPNVLIGEGEIMKISDFGTSRTWNGYSEKMTFAGTVAWMAPEAIQEKECSEKIDIWSYGVVLWELLTCQVPYGDLEQCTIMYLVGSGKITLPIPKTCFTGFRLIMENCWKQHPRDRPSFKAILDHLRLAQVEILAYEDQQFFKTQESWKEEISEEMRSQVTQFQAQLQMHRIERDTEMKHIKNVKEMYDRKLEKVQQLYLELSNVLQQVEQHRQEGRKRETQNKKRPLNPFGRKMERRRSTQSTTPTSPEHSITSPDSPHHVTPIYAELTPDSQSVVQTVQTIQRFRKRSQRNNSASPRNSRGSRTSNKSRMDAETQTDSLDSSEADLSPVLTSPPDLRRLPQRVILQQEVAADGSTEESSNGNCVYLHYMVQPKEPLEVFARTDSTRPLDLCDADDDTLNRNNEYQRDYSDDDNLETIGRKVSALKNGNIFSDMRISTENGNVTEELGEVIRKVCSETRNGQDSTEDTYNDSDEEGEVHNTLRRGSSLRRPIYPSRRSNRSKYSFRQQREGGNASDEGNTSEYSVSPSSKSSTLESNPDKKRVPNQLKRPNENSDASASESESEENVTVVTQVPYSLGRQESVA